MILPASAVTTIRTSSLSDSELKWLCATKVRNDREACRGKGGCEWLAAHHGYSDVICAKALDWPEFADDVLLRIPRVDIAARGRKDKRSDRNSDS
jgi:hypothetical protein